MNIFTLQESLLMFIAHLKLIYTHNEILTLAMLL